MPTKAIFEEGAKIRELKEEQARILQKTELLRREQQALLDSNSDIRKRILDGKEDVGEVEKKHLTSIGVYEEKGTDLLNEIIERQESLKNLLRSVSDMENQLASVTKKHEQRSKDLVKIESQYEEKGRSGEAETIRLLADIKDKLEELTETTKSLNATRDENILVQQDTNERIKKAEKEERLISIRRNDLEIYEARLRKRYPEAKIIL